MGFQNPNVRFISRSFLNPQFFACSSGAVFIMAPTILILVILINTIWQTVYAAQLLSSLVRSGGDLDPLANKCKEVGYSYVSDKDCTTYFECKKTQHGIWTTNPHTCDNGKTFDDTSKRCVDLYGYCPNEPVDTKFPDISKCTAPDQKYVLPGDCGHYFRCHAHAGKFSQYFPEVLQCPGSQKFDDKIKVCVDGECPQDLQLLPDGDGWHCSTLGDFNVLPTDCSKFYKCLQCSKNPNGWCYKELACEEGFSYDDTIKACVETPCPQDLPEKPHSPGWPCTTPGELNVSPENCANYYQCFQCSKPSGWCIQMNSCPTGHYFDNDIHSCIPSEICPQDLVPVPENWPCGTEENDLVNPDYCNQFYTCVPCNKPEAHGKCMITGSCPTGQNFDNHGQTCVDGVCPQTLKPNLPGVQECTEQGEKNQDPQSCRQYYECHKCSFGDKGWCHIDHSCPEGENFDETMEKCVASPCPQTIQAIPERPGWSCQHNGQTSVHPEECTKWYVCYQCSKSPKGWCVVTESCPTGQFFNDETDTCVASQTCPQGSPPAVQQLPVLPVAVDDQLTAVVVENNSACDHAHKGHMYPDANDNSRYFKCKCGKRGFCKLVAEKCRHEGVYSSEQQTCVYK